MNPFPPFHIHAPVAVPTITTLHYHYSQGRKVVRTPFVFTGGARFVVAEGHMRGYLAVPIIRTAVQLISEPRVITRFMIFTRRGPSLPENEGLAALSGGIGWRGDVFVVRRGKRRGEEYVNIGSGAVLAEADVAVKLLMLHVRRTGIVPSGLGFVRDGVDMPFGGGPVFNVGAHQFQEVDNNEAIPPYDGGGGDSVNGDVSSDEDDGIESVRSPPRRATRLAASYPSRDVSISSLDMPSASVRLTNSPITRRSPRLAARPSAVVNTPTPTRTSTRTQQNATAGPSSLRAPVLQFVEGTNATPGPSTQRAHSSTDRRRSLRVRSEPYPTAMRAPEVKSCFSQGL